MTNPRSLIEWAVHHSTLPPMSGSQVGDHSGFQLHATGSVLELIHRSRGLRSRAARQLVGLRFVSPHARSRTTTVSVQSPTIDVPSIWSRFVTATMARQHEHRSRTSSRLRNTSPTKSRAPRTQQYQTGGKPNGLRRLLHRFRRAIVAGPERFEQQGPKWTELCSEIRDSDKLLAAKLQPYLQQFVAVATESRGRRNWPDQVRRYQQASRKRVAPLRAPGRRTGPGSLRAEQFAASILCKHGYVAVLRVHLGFDLTRRMFRSEFVVASLLKHCGFSAPGCGPPHPTSTVSINSRSV